MNIDNKLPQFKSLMSDNNLSKGSVKTAIDQALVASTEQSNVSLELKDEKKSGLDKKKKKKNETNEFQSKSDKESGPSLKNTEELKITYLKRLNFL